MDVLLQNVREILAAMGCKPEDAGYTQRFNDLFLEERRRADDQQRRADDQQRRADETAAEERRLAAEERRLAAEERRLAAEAEERRLDREHQLQMAQHPSNQAPQDGGNQQPLPPPRIIIDVLPFSPASERADRFIKRFETILDREKAPKERYAEQLLKALPPAEATPLLELPVEEQFDYEILKKAFLRRHRVTETQLRDDFRNVRPTKDDNAAAFLRTVSRAFDYWIDATEMEKNFDNLRDRLIVDQVTDLLPNHLLVLLREKGASTVEGITTHLDAYFDARPHQSLHQACQLASKHSAAKDNASSRPGALTKTPAATAPSNSRPSPVPRPHSNLPPQPHTPSTVTPSAGPARPNTPRSGRGTPTAATPPAGAPRQSGGTTFQKGCRHHGRNALHTSEQCYVLHPERRLPVPPAGTTDWSMPTALPTSPRTANVAITDGFAYQEVPAQTSDVDEGNIPQDDPVHALTALTSSGDQSSKGAVKTCTGTLNQKPVEILLDSGCDSVFVARRLLDPTSFTGATKAVRTATALHHGCPVAKATLQCPYYLGGPTLVVVLDDPPYDVLLGQVPGTYKFSEDPPQTICSGAKQPLKLAEVGSLETLAAHSLQACQDLHPRSRPTVLSPSRRDPNHWRQPAISSTPPPDPRRKPRPWRRYRSQQQGKQRHQYTLCSHCQNSLSNISPGVTKISGTLSVSPSRHGSNDFPPQGAVKG